MMILILSCSWRRLDRAPPQRDAAQHAARAAARALSPKGVPRGSAASFGSQGPPLPRERRPARPAPLAIDPKSRDKVVKTRPELDRRCPVEPFPSSSCPLRRLPSARFGHPRRGGAEPPVGPCRHVFDFFGGCRRRASAIRTTAPLCDPRCALVPASYERRRSAVAAQRQQTAARTDSAPEPLSESFCG